MKRAEELAARHKEGEFPRPPLWYAQCKTIESRFCQVRFRGGYLVVPRSIEFWQGQTDRIHDRIRFRRPEAGEVPDGIVTHLGENGWVYERLAP